MSGVRVIGLGNPYRGDDAVGLAVARRVGTTAPSGVEVVEYDGEPADLIDECDGCATAYVVDMTHSGAEPGTVSWIDVSAGDLPLPPTGSSSHHLGLAETIALARVLGRLPGRLIVVGVEGCSTRAGAGLSAQVVAGADAAAERLLAALEHDLRETDD